MSYAQRYAEKHLMTVTLKKEDKAFIQKLSELTNSKSSSLLRTIIEEALDNLRGKTNES